MQIFGLLSYKRARLRHKISDSFGRAFKGEVEAYLKLESENAYSQDTDSYLAQKEKKFKEIAKINRRR